MVLGFGLLASGVGCSSSGDSAGGGSSTSAAPSSTATTVARTPATTAVPLSPAGAEAATTLTDTSGFEADQSACMVSVVVERVGETVGLPMFGATPGELSSAQQDALVASFEGCLSADDLGGLVGVTFQALATQVGGELDRDQLVCAGRELIGAHSLRALLFDEALLPRVFADNAAVTALLTPCLPAPLVAALATAAVQVATEASAAASTTAP